MTELPRTPRLTAGGPGHKRQFWLRHRLRNCLKTALPVWTLIGIAALAGGLLLGERGLWIAPGASLLALLFEPAAAAAPTLKLYGARAIRSGETPEIGAVRTVTCNRS
jgi:heat shock protein HtpX